MYLHGRLIRPPLEGEGPSPIRGNGGVDEELTKTLENRRSHKEPIFPKYGESFRRPKSRLVLIKTRNKIEHSSASEGFVSSPAGSWRIVDPKNAESSRRRANPSCDILPEAGLSTRLNLVFRALFFFLLCVIRRKSLIKFTCSQRLRMGYKSFGRLLPTRTCQQGRTSNKNLPALFCPSLLFDYTNLKKDSQLGA